MRASWATRHRRLRAHMAYPGAWHSPGNGRWRTVALAQELGIATINLFGDHPSYRRNIQAICSAFDTVISLPEVHQGNIVVIAFKKTPVLDFADLYARAGVIRDITKLPARSWVDGMKSAVSSAASSAQDADSPADR